MPAGLAFGIAALLMPVPAGAGNEGNIEYGCLPVVLEHGRTRIVASPQFHTFDLAHPGEGKRISLPRGTIGIHCSRYRLVLEPDDYLILRRGLSLYIQSEYDRPAPVILLLEMKDGAPHARMVRGEASEAEKQGIDAAIAAFPSR